SSIGGTATLVGSPPNLIFLSNYIKAFPGDDTVNFSTWFIFGLPSALILFAAAYFILKKMFVGKNSYASLDPSLLKDEYKQLGKINYEEKIVLSVFILTAALWFTRADLMIGELMLPGWGKLLPNPGFYTDATVAIFMAIVLFLIPSKSQKGEMVMDTK